MRAVVYNRRPLCLFIYLVFGTALGLAAMPTAAHAQLFPKKPSLQIRLGGFYSTPLVDDFVSSAAVDDSIPGTRSDKASIRLEPGPIGSLALRLPLRGSTQLEVSASAARSKVRGDDGFETWDVSSATLGNFVLGFGYLYRNAVVVRAGVGATKVFADDRGLFAKGNSIRPLLEGGVSSALPIGNRSIDVDLRVQTHSFTTATLRDNGADSGNVTRLSVQLGYTLWGGGR
jgi:hypothetical protein